MKKMILGSVSAENLVGPVGIVKIAGDVRSGGLVLLSQYHGANERFAG